MRRKLLQQKHTVQDEQEIREKLKTTPLEKNDLLAMTIAGFIVILPAVLLILGGVTVLLLALFVW